MKTIKTVSIDFGENNSVWVSVTDTNTGFREVRINNTVIFKTDDKRAAWVLMYNTVSALLGGKPE